ncbi:MAG: (2Fe-2S)-binding protein [Lachnospiraceae bacterium]|nr:(2Fe-2S)-binding protein [Lachnospiraceae bacterium]MDO4733823.1 2Fe-2S iron-sulfur cluster-binding protein [Lachnospiraceae bacterium]
MNITIDGKSCQCEKGEYILQIARRNGIIIPTLCHHDGFPGQGSCRLCIVEVNEGSGPKVVVSCVYPVSKECVVFTNSEKIRKQRGMILTLLQKRAPESEEIKAFCKMYGAPEIDRFVKVDNSKCILCGLCVKACTELSVGAISTINRGITKEIATPYHEPSSVCVGCGSCAYVCPTGAIAIEETDETRTIWGKTFHLVHCTSCGSVIGTEEELACAAQKAGHEPDTLCGPCRKKELAKAFRHTYGEIPAE